MTSWKTYPVLASPVHVIMAADVEQDDFLLCYEKREGNPVAVSEADGMAAGEFAAQGVKRKVRLERVVLQVCNHSCEAWLEVGMLFEEFAGLAQKLLRSGNGVHYTGSSVSRALSRSSAVLNFFTRPALTSSSEARTRAR